MTEGLQPFLSDGIVALRAPTQVWSGRSGEIGAHAIDGLYHGDTRFVRATALTYGPAGAEPDIAPEWISVAEHSASEVSFDAVLRGVDDDWPDPKVRLERVRTVTDGGLDERLTVSSHLSEPVELRLRLRLTPDFAPLQEVKAGTPPTATWTATRGSDAGAIDIDGGGARMRVSAPDARVAADADVTLEWMLTCPARGEVQVTWSATLDDPSLVVRGAAARAPWADAAPASGADPRLARWVRRALSDLDALRLTLPGHPDDEFLAAGTPWFLTLFGRDSLWAARLLLPVDVATAASTLRVLARLQGTAADPDTAEEPGKILHELRAGELRMPGEGIVLPPRYYGTVDATPLWVCLLGDAAAAGMSEDEVRDLLPALEAALGWMRAGAGEDGFLEYVDETGRGLSNQGWKDSGDSIQWRTGELAEGPIALCEVQGYAYEAAYAGADLLERFGRDGADDIRRWADALRARFQERFWVTTDEGTYPAIALDRDGRGVDTLTSNIGHLLGTGILDPEQETGVARLLVGPTMSSGFGLRTMSTGAAGYWPLSYHGGSVWAHDTAIVAHGMARAGLHEDADILVAGLLAAAEAFGFRMPELHAGDPAERTPAPAPYPAACRPQAWSAAAAIACLAITQR
ncbi:glycogen debranching N-terminal domain-containing protein [uncultured Microbacterium sp.]|uniref:Glycogen debranching enzyme n=1 Tax=uncultured Microbacterium sp. TaxID=191216 RepID=A0A1Y5NUC1_9MICO|nr:glycogen debranching N-terminal domain-containing protein [uncultured Microbacterium sp.]SBS69994.1 Glycogen debranching enzyme [uncultured Microbacterium sp.]